MVSFLLLGLQKGNYIIKKSENLSSRLDIPVGVTSMESLKMKSSNQNLFMYSLKVIRGF